MFFLYETEILEEEIFLYEDSTFDFIKSLNETNENNKIVFSEFKKNLISKNKNINTSENERLTNNSRYLCVNHLSVDFFDINSNRLAVSDLLKIFKKNIFSKEPFPLIVKFNYNIMKDEVISEFNQWANSTINIKKYKSDDYSQLIKFLPKKNLNFICDKYKMNLVGCTFIQYIKNNKDTICVLVDKCEFYD